MITRKARVQKVITDKILHESEYKKYGEEESIGGIIYTFLEDPTPLNFDVSKLTTFAKPLQPNIHIYPVPGEIVNLFISPGPNYNQTGIFDVYYLPPVNINTSPNSSALPDILDVNNTFYQGEYFLDLPNINPLLPYEGDIIMEGRFGQSIRFGSTIDNAKVSNPNKWSNEGSIGNPITIIRNGQGFNPNTKNGEYIVEDIDNDFSSIYLCSKQQLSNFQPASLNDESYGQDIFKETPQNEPNIPDDTMDNNIKQDIVLNSADPLPAQELQVINEPIPIKETEYASNDIAETEKQALSPTTETSINNVPDYIDQGSLNNEFS